MPGPVSTSDVDPCLGVAELAEGPVPSGQWMGESRRVTSTSTGELVLNLDQHQEVLSIFKIPLFQTALIIKLP